MDTKNGCSQSKNGRPRMEIDLQEFLNLYAKGYTDELIAENLSVSRSTVIRIRKEQKLQPNRKKGGRGLGKPKENESYYLQVRQLMNDPLLSRKIWSAARKVKGDNEIKDGESLAYTATIIDPYPVVPRFAPGIASVKPEEVPESAVKFIINSMKLAEAACLAGVPGKEIFQLARIIGTEDEERKDGLALAAVMSAGYVNVDARLGEVEQPLRMTARSETWDEQMSQLINSEAIKIKEIKAKFTRYRHTVWGKTGTGMRGNGGGIRSYESAVSFSGLSRI
ncbi:MAG: hypothetical protein K6U74_12435 [Firmicutes bacterium]|nr:hypothetical protein [Bacillota bacterium]